jgi:putative Holliday junction resolvase
VTGVTASELPARGRLLGVDLGTVRIGIAVSDSAQHIALAHQVLRRSGEAEQDRRAVAALVEEFGAVGVVVGMPLRLSGEIGPAARAALGEVEALTALLTVPVATVDERLSTVEATRRQREGGGRGRRRAVDDAAAAVFLQGFLDRRIADAARAAPS